MEKRLVVSFLLSFLVLVIWANFVPQNKNVQSVEPQIIEETSESISKLDNISSSETGDATPSPKPNTESIKAEQYSLENEKFILTFSNLGAHLDSVYLKEYEVMLPISDILGIADYQDVTFKIQTQQERKIVFSHIAEDFSLTKIYTINPSDYTINSDITIQNNQEMSKKMTFDLKGFTLNMMDKSSENSNLIDSEAKKGMADQRDRGLNEYVINSEDGIKRKNNAYKFGDKDRISGNSPINWLGFRNRYYCAIMKPQFDTFGYSTENVQEKSMDIHIDLGKMDFNPLEKKNFSLVSYVGPEKVELLKEYESGFENIQRYYKLGLFDSIAKLINKLMMFIHKFVPNWGLCIIIISVIIYYSMYPLTAKGMSSMRKMQALQPKIQALKEKHEKNPQKLNQEMLELYKKEKINPLGGCFPILFQMPVFIGLYQVLWRNVEFKGANFLWIKDLSVPDRLFLLDFNLPLIGNEINLLPLLMIVIMFFQQKFSSRNITITDPAQLQQQKMMMIIMPLFLGFIFYKFASGLTLYFTMFYIFSTLTQWKISKAPKVA